MGEQPATSRRVSAWGAFAETRIERCIQAMLRAYAFIVWTLSPSLVWTPTLIFMMPVLRCVKRGLSGRW
jgi:hypothetical protein